MSRRALLLVGLVLLSAARSFTVTTFTSPDCKSASAVPGALTAFVDACSPIGTQSLALASCSAAGGWLTAYNSQNCTGPVTASGAYSPDCVSSGATWVKVTDATCRVPATELTLLTAIPFCGAPGVAYYGQPIKSAGAAGVCQAAVAFNNFDVKAGRPWPDSSV